MNWYELAIMLGLGLIAVIGISIMVAKYLVKNGKIDQCPTCKKYIIKKDFEKHLKEAHSYWVEIIN